MKDENMGFFLIGLLFGCLFFPIGYWSGKGDLYEEAIRNGSAAYNVKGDFVWLNCLKENQQKTSQEPYIGFIDE